MTTKTLPDHGTLSRHKHYGCRCDTCLDNYRTYVRARHRKIGYGTWQPYVDAEPVRQHLLDLHDNGGLSYAVIAEHLGRSVASITSFIYELSPTKKRRKRATPELANAILAIKPGDITPGMVDGTGTTRRIQALAANGWPMKTLSARIGLAAATVGRLAGQKWVFRATAQGVADCYEQLKDERPEDHGVTAWVAQKTRNRAASEGWRDPVWWEDMGDIDDPTFDPDQADRPLGRNELGAHRRSEIEHLASFGLSDHDIAARLGMAPAYVHDLVREMRKRQRSERPSIAA